MLIFQSPLKMTFIILNNTLNYFNTLSNVSCSYVFSCFCSSTSNLLKKCHITVEVHLKMPQRNYSVQISTTIFKIIIIIITTTIVMIMSLQQLLLLFRMQQS